MSLIVPKRFLLESENSFDHGDKSPSLRSTLSSATNQTSLRNFHRSLSLASGALRLQAGPSIDIPMDLSDDDNDFDDNASSKENSRFAPRMLRRQRSRQNSIQSTAPSQRDFRPTTATTTSGPAKVKTRKSEFLVIQAPPAASISMEARRTSFHTGAYIPMAATRQQSNLKDSSDEVNGETLLHLTARLGHDEIMRFLICETSQAGILTNRRGQTPLLIAIESGSTSTATLLMESDPRSIVVSDVNQSSVFHYACEHCNDVVLHRAIVLSKRLYSTSDRITVCDAIEECHSVR